MRNLHFILRAFAGAVAITTLVACEEETPPGRTTAAASTSAPAPTMPTMPTPVASKPAEAVVVKPTPPVQIAVADGGSDEDEPDDLIAGARAALGKGELDRALKLARLATKRNPQRSAAWNTLGRVQLKRGARKDAIASFQEAVERNPSSSYAQNNLGLALIYDGQYDDAVDALEEATQLQPVEGYMWNNLGMAYEHLDRLEEARDAYQTAMQEEVPRARENFARLQGVKSVRTAKADVPATIATTPDVDVPHDEVGIDDASVH
jgi:Flp pilus assembly protein TadD